MSDSINWNMIGHTWAVDFLRRSIAGGHVAHAYLLSGPAGVGKALLALRLAQALNCATGGPDPCLICRACKRIERGNYPDVRVAGMASQGAGLKPDEAQRQKDLKIDTSKRKLPFWFYFKNHLVFETEITLPESEKISNLPQGLTINRAGYSFTGSYSMKASKLSYRLEIVLQQPEIKPDEFGQWNKDINQLKEFYNQQIVLTKTK